MKEFQYTVKDACGIHARPAGLLVKVAKGFASTATLEKDGKSCDMRKLMALMGMGVKQGDTVTVQVEGRCCRGHSEVPDRERLIFESADKSPCGRPCGGFFALNSQQRRENDAGRNR